MSRARLAAVLVALLSIILAALIVTDALPVMRGPGAGGEWQWPYLLRPVARWWPSLLSALLLGATGTWWVVRASRRVWPLVLIVVLTLALQLGLLYADRPNVGGELVDRTLAKDTSGYAAVAGEIDDLNAALSDYPALMGTFDNEHARTHPPGLVAAFYLGDRALRLWPGLAEALARPVRLWRCTDLWVLARPLSTAGSLLVGAWLPLLAASLVPAAAWLVARRLVRGAAVPLAAALSATIPALLIFAPTPDQIFALLALLSLWAALRGLDTGSLPWLGLSGVIVSGMTFLSIGNAAWAGLLVAYVVVSAYRRGWAGRRWLIGVGALVGGALSLWLVYWLGWGVAPWSVVAAGLDQHYLLVTSQRSYATWLVHNPLDFALFAGLTVVAGWLAVVAFALLRPAWRRSEVGVLALLLVLLLAVLLISGGTRGEVGRLWLVFMPLAAVLAAAGWAGAEDELLPGTGTVTEATPRLPVIATILAAQLILALAIGLAWRPLQAVILPVIMPDMAPVPSESRPLNSAFQTSGDETLTLAGHAPVEFGAPGEPLDVQLLWTADGPTLDPYTVFVHVVDAAGTLVAQHDGWPVAGAWPTTCWRAGEVISDPVAVELPATLAPGEYTILIGLYGGADGTRLRTADGLDAILIDRFSVEQD